MKKLALVMVTFLMVTLTFSPFETANAVKVIRIGHIQNQEHPHHLALVKFAELVKQKTGGSVEVRVLPNSQLGDALTQIQSVKMGTIEAFLDGVGWYGQFIGDYYLFATAFAMKDWNYCVKVMEGPVGQEIANKLLKQEGLKTINQTWYRLPRQLLARKPIRSVADVNGIKMRIPALTSYIQSWKALGASPTPIPFSEVYLALQQGVVDAMESPIDNIYTQKLHEVAKYLMLTYHQYEPGNLVMNAKFFNSLSNKEQKAVMEAADEAQAYNNKLTFANEKTVLDKFRNEGVTIIEVDREEFVNKCKNVPLQLEEKGLWTKGLYAKVMQSK